MNFLPIFCIFFCLGIAFVNAFRISFFLLFALAATFLSLSLIFWRRNLKFNIFILLFAFFLGASMLKNAYLLPKCHIAKFIPYHSQLVSLKGVVISDPIKAKARTTFVLKSEELYIGKNRQSVCGSVQVAVFNRDDLAYGQEIILFGKLHRPFSLKIKSRLSYKKYLQQQGIYAILSVSFGSPIRYLVKDKGNLILESSFWLKHKIQYGLARNLSSLSASILNAMLLGERKDVPDFINQSMVHTGTVHILVVSGFNVGIVGFIVLLFLKVCRIPQRLRYIITASLLIFYCLMTGASVPVVRATIMGMVILISYLLKRQADIYNSLSLAALIILSFNPRQLFDIGFQLSFISVLSIAFLYPKFYALFPRRVKKANCIDFIIKVFCVSLSACLGTMGLIVYYFGIFTPIAIIANMLIAPYASLITACGLSLVVINWLLPAIAPLFAASSELSVISLLKLNTLLEKLPLAYVKLPVVFLWQVLFYYSFLILVAFYIRSAIIVKIK